MKFTTNFQTLSFDLAAYERALTNHLVEENKRAGQVWIHAAVEQIPIPTWSGASRATFQKLAEELGTSVPIGPRMSREDRAPLGRALSTASGVITDTRNHFYGFMYSSNLRYLAYNEFNRAVPGPPPQPFGRLRTPTPYHFQEKGLKAWVAFAKTVKLPDPFSSKFLKRTKI